MPIRLSLILMSLLVANALGELHSDNAKRAQARTEEARKVDCGPDIANLTVRCRQAPGDRGSDEDLARRLRSSLSDCTEPARGFEGLYAAARWESKRVAGEVEALQESETLRDIIEAIRIEKLGPPNRPWPPNLTERIRAFEREADDPQLRSVASILYDALEGQLSGSAEQLTQVLANAPLFEPNPIHPLQNFCTSLPERVHQSYSFDPKHALWELVLLFSLEDTKTPHDRVKLDENRTPVLPPLATALGKMLQQRDPSGLRVVPLSHLLMPYVDARVPDSSDGHSRRETIEFLAQNLASHLVPHPSPLFKLWSERTSLVLDRPADGSKVEMIIPRSDHAARVPTLRAVDGEKLSVGVPQEQPILFGTAIHTTFKLDLREGEAPLRQTGIVNAGSEQAREVFQFSLEQPPHSRRAAQDKLKKRTGPNYQEFDSDGVRKGLMLCSDSSVEVLVGGYTDAGFNCQKLNTVGSIQDRVQRLMAADQKASLDYLLLDSIRPFDPKHASLVPEVAAWDCNKPKKGSTPEQSITVALYKDSMPPDALSAERSALALDWMLSKKRGVKPLLALSAEQGPNKDPFTSKQRNALAFSILHGHSDFVSVKGNGVPFIMNHPTVALSSAAKMLIEGWDYARMAKEDKADIRDFSWMDENIAEVPPMGLKRREHTFNESAFYQRTKDFNSLPTELPEDAVQVLREMRLDRSVDREVAYAAGKWVPSSLLLKESFDAWNIRARLERLKLDDSPSWLSWAYWTDSLETLHPQALTVNGRWPFRPTLRALTDSGVSGKAAQLALMQLDDTLQANSPKDKLSQEMHRLALETALVRQTPMPAGWLDPPRDTILQETLAKRTSDRRLSVRSNSANHLVSLDTFDGSSDAAKKLVQALKRDPALVNSIVDGLRSRKKPIPNPGSFEETLVSLTSHSDAVVAGQAKRALAALGLRLDFVVPQMIEDQKKSRLRLYESSGLIEAAARGNDAAIASIREPGADLFQAYEMAKQYKDEPARKKLSTAIRTLKTERVLPSDLTSLLDHAKWQDVELLMSLIGRKDYRDADNIVVRTIEKIGGFEGTAPAEAAKALRQYASLKTRHRPAALLTLAIKDPQSTQWAGDEIERELMEGSADYAFANAVFRLSKAGLKDPMALSNLKTTLKKASRDPSSDYNYSSLVLLSQASPPVRERVAEYLLSEIKHGVEPLKAYRQWLVQLGETGQRMARSALRSSDALFQNSLSILPKYMRASPERDRFEREMMKRKNAEVYRFINDSEK